MPLFRIAMSLATMQCFSGFTISLLQQPAVTALINAKNHPFVQQPGAAHANAQTPFFA